MRADRVHKWSSVQLMKTAFEHGCMSYRAFMLGSIRALMLGRQEKFNKLFQYYKIQLAPNVLKALWNIHY